MKNLITALIAVILLSAANSQAMQYNIKVGSFDKTTQEQSQLSVLAGRFLLIDTDQQNVTFDVTPICPVGYMCPQVFEMLTFKIRKMIITDNHLTTLVAEGYLNGNGEALPTRLVIGVQENNRSILEFTSFRVHGDEKSFVHFNTILRGGEPTEAPVIF